MANININNEVRLIGRLTRDPKVTSYANAQGNNDTCARFTIAANRAYKDKDGNSKADFPSCVCFGKTAEIIQKYAKQGTQLAVVGELRTDSYEKDGAKVYTTEVNVTSVQLLGSKPKEETPAAEAFENVSDEDMPWE